jgi:hypothetical protein
MKDATAAAEHLKQVVQDVLAAFQTGAGIWDGRPEPMTFELAVHTLWRAIDEAFFNQRPRGLAQLRLSKDKDSGTLEELVELLTVCGTWNIRATIRNAKLVAHVVGKPNGRLAAVISFLREKGWTVTDLALSA